MKEVSTDFKGKTNQKFENLQLWMNEQWAQVSSTSSDFISHGEINSCYVNYNAVLQLANNYDTKLSGDLFEYKQANKAMYVTVNLDPLGSSFFHFGGGASANVFYYFSSPRLYFLVSSDFNFIGCCLLFVAFALIFILFGFPTCLEYFRNIYTICHSKIIV